MSLRTYLKFFVAIFIFFILVVSFFLFTPIIKQKEGVVYYLRPGLSKRAVIQGLTSQGVIRQPFFFSLYAFFTPQAKLKAGEYLFPYGVNFVNIWHQLTTGTGLYYRSFTLIPGWTFKQFQTALLTNPWLKKEAIDDKKLEQLGMMPSSSEGMFYPDTYYFTRGESDFDIMVEASKLMRKKLNAVWATRSKDLPYTSPYVALIVASMVEKEAYLDRERPIIVSVILNRLRMGMPLQIDATVIYALGDQYEGKLYKRNLQVNSIYNTYQNKGLPPTPIAFPSLASITAAVHPEVTDFYFYVARSDGSHQFSKTLDEHNAAIKQLKIERSQLLNLFQ